MKRLKKIGRFFCSMKFALILLLILVVVCTIGSLIQQNQVESYYTTQFSAQAARAILLFGLDDVFHSIWFVVLTILLCLNLILCNLVHFPSLIRRTREGFSMENALKSWDETPVVTVKEPEGLFKHMGFRKIEKKVLEDGRECLYSVKNKSGLWGAWLTHLGILIIIVGFALGQTQKKEYTVYGVAGQTKAVGDTKYDLTIDDFEVQLREDETVEQYLAKVTMTDRESGKQESGETSVNHPLSMFGMKCYQNSTGWAATVEVQKDGKTEQEEVLCAGEYLTVDALEGVAVVFSAFYPDYAQDENGHSMTKSSAFNNPGYLYRLYYHDQVLGMNVLTNGEMITVEGVNIIFRDPQSYTLLQVKRDPYTGVTAVGGALVLLALILAFYLRPAELWAVKTEEEYAFAGRSRKGGQLFLEELKEKGEKHGSVSEH
ncbi:MAG: cytochrome c biogenesis protein ResB [Eubacteriales bacterium]|nr:cytochrome c biogenesis protein ResB [Eubacteriales bacterium]